MLFVGVAYSLMLTLVLAPGESSRLIVIFKNNPENTGIYSILNETNGALVDQISTHAFVVESDRPGFAEALYRGGAFLVVNGDGLYGCGASLEAGALPEGFREKQKESVRGRL
jgi:hypothetical protein